jgi:hypothetical protein
VIGRANECGRISSRSSLFTTYALMIICKRIRSSACARDLFFFHLDGESIYFYGAGAVKGWKKMADLE